MKTNAFKKIAYKFFPSLEINERRYITYHKILEVFTKIHYVTTEEKVLNLITQYKQIKNNILSEDQKIFNKILSNLDDIVDFTKGIITDPINFAITLDKKIDIIKPQGLSTNNLSLQCACASIIGVLTKELTLEEKQEQFLIQQLRLNVALNGQETNVVNYWYSLHWYLRNNKKNAQVFLSKLLQNPKKADLELILDQEVYPWLKEKIPQEFQDFSINEYKKHCKLNLLSEKLKHNI